MQRKTFSPEVAIKKQCHFVFGGVMFLRRPDRCSLWPKVELVGQHPHGQPGMTWSSITGSVWRVTDRSLIGLDMGRITLPSPTLPQAVCFEPLEALEDSLQPARGSRAMLA